MVRTKEELLSSIRETFGENTDDNALAIIEDISDTMDSYNDGKDWKAEAERKSIFSKESTFFPFYY